MTKKGGEFEIIAIDFLEKIFKELKFAVVRKRIQISGSQDGYDNLIDIVNEKYINRSIYSECKDYTSELNYTDAIIKLPQIATTHNNIDLVVFISPKRNFSNIFEETRNKPFLESLANTNFKVTFLSPETDIHKYFSLYPEIYKKVYSSEAPYLTENDREEILNQFDKFIFSDKNLQKIVIDECDKEKYIGNIALDEYHIKRSIRNSPKREYEFYFPESNKKTLFSEIYENKLGIVLLGNPGFGKTSELKQLAIELWDSRQEENIIPFFKSLKNFTTSSIIEDFLPQNFKLIPKQIVIFDGVDEIEKIIDFSNKLRNFIIGNKEIFKDDKLKFIISCRTNIYNKYIKSISGFGVYFLNEINFSSGLNFLKAKYNLNLEEAKTFDTYKNKEILENPFYLDLIGNYYKNQNEVLTNKALLIEEFVNSRLKNDKANKFANDTEFDKERIISYTQKVAFSLEAMQKPYLTITEIKKITGVDEISLAKNPFLEENITENWSFVLKNIQEYFVAHILAELSFDEIVKIIQIDSSTSKVHPTWYNVITFLLNLVCEETLYNSLVNWLLINDFEILFNADSDRITENIKSKVLINLFTKNCIEDSLWINDSRGIATFSECDTNIKYLISKIKDVSIHRRARMSAIKLLSYMNVKEEYLKELKSIIIDIINEINFEDENYIYLLQDAIMLTQNLSFNNDVTFFNKLIKLLISKDNKEIVSSIINCAPTESVIDNIDYFLEILDKALGNKKWNTIPKYNSITSTKDNILNLFTNIYDGSILLKIYEFSIERQKNYQFRESLLKEFLKHISLFFKDKTEFHSDLIIIISNAVIEDKANLYEDSLLLEVVKSCGIEKPIFDNIIEAINGNSNSKRFLAEIVDVDDFEKILKKYNVGVLNEEFLLHFRNILSHRNFDLSKKFEECIESSSKFVFTDKMTQIDEVEKSEFWKTKDQKNFDVLFDNNELTNQILKFYEYLGKDELSLKEVNKHYHKYYNDFEFQKSVTENAKHLLYEILRDNYPDGEKLSKKNVYKEVLNSSLNIMYDILNNLPLENKGKNIEISETQKHIIEKWCKDNTNLAKDYYLNHLCIKDRWDSDKYHLFEAIYKFQKFFKFNLDEELLLDMLWFNDTERGFKTEYLNGIVSVENINNRILKNISSNKLSPSSYCNHLKYCFENKIEIDVLKLDLKSKVYEFLNTGNHYYAGEIIDNFLNSDINALKEFLNYTSSRKKETNIFIYDCIISLLIKQKKESIAIDFLNNNYIDLITNDIYTEKEIIRKLISLNYDTAFKKFYELVKNQIENNVKGEFEFREQEWLRFTQSEELEVLVNIFELSLSTRNIEELFGNHYSPVRITSEVIANICKTNSELECTKALELLNKIDVKNLEANKIDLFYLNKLKNDVQEIYYNQKSKPYKLPEVLKILEENKYLFIA